MAGIGDLLRRVADSISSDDKRLALGFVVCNKWLPGGLLCDMRQVTRENGLWQLGRSMFRDRKFPIRTGPVGQFTFAVLLENCGVISGIRKKRFALAQGLPWSVTVHWGRLRDFEVTVGASHGQTIFVALRQVCHGEREGHSGLAVASTFSVLVRRRFRRIERKYREWRECSGAETSQHVGGARRVTYVCCWNMTRQQGSKTAGGQK